MLTSIGNLVHIIDIFEIRRRVLSPWSTIQAFPGTSNSGLIAEVTGAYVNLLEKAFIQAFHEMDNAAGRHALSEMMRMHSVVSQDCHLYFDIYDRFIFCTFPWEDPKNYTAPIVSMWTGKIEHGDRKLCACPDCEQSRTLENISP
jgi:hypothetical protein